MRKYHGGADVLVCLAWIYTKADVSLNGGVKLGRIGFDSKLNSVL